MAVYIIIENIKNPICAEIKQVFNKNGYITSTKNTLKSIISSSIFKKLIKRGLYKNIESGLNKTDNRFSIHRLVSCLYYSILGLEVHHLSKRTNENHIWNLVPLESSIHDEVDNAEIIKGFYIALEQEEIIQKQQFKSIKQTVACNKNLILEILKLRCQNES